MDFLRGDPVDPIEEIKQREVTETVSRCINMLESRQARVIHCRFMLGMTLEDVGFDLHVTRERVRQIEAEAIYEMKHGRARAILNEVRDV